MKRILIIAAVLALAAGGYYFLTHTPLNNGAASAGAPPATSGGGDGVSLNSQPSTLNSPTALRPVVEPFVERPLMPPPSAPPAGWVQPKFAEAKSKLVQHPPRGRAAGEAVVARVETGDSTHEVHPNQAGHFERLNVGRKMKVPFAVGYPMGRPGETIIAVAEDSGTLGKNSVTAAVALDVDRVARFEFETADRDGLFRVTIKKGADVKALEFWAGGPPKVAATDK